MEDNDQKAELLINVILGVGEYSKIKTKTMIKVGKQNELIAEKTHLGWTITTPGKDREVTSMMLTRNSMYDHDQLCRLDVLGIEDSHSGDQMYIYQEFQTQGRWILRNFVIMETRTPTTSQQQKWEPIKIR